MATPHSSMSPTGSSSGYVTAISLMSQGKSLRLFVMNRSAPASTGREVHGVRRTQPVAGAEYGCQLCCGVVDGQLLETSEESRERVHLVAGLPAKRAGEHLGEQHYRPHAGRTGPWAPVPDARAGHTR
jgi:hypothetical protein